jgi:4'-phosphopantetheinyl transferase
MNHHEVLIWYIEPETLQDSAQVKRFLEWLSPDEREQYQRFHFDKHRHTYLVSHALVRGALSLVTKLRPEQFSFKKNPYGKPYLDQSVPSRALHFNLSHTDGLAVLAISTQAEVGVDVENSRRTGMTRELAEHFFSSEEYQVVAYLQDPERTIKMLEFWTLKESYIKAVGAGLSIALDSFAFALGREGCPARLIRLDSNPLEIDQWYFWQGQPTPQHLIALAIKGTEKKSTLDIKLEHANWLYRA